jgi:hypothetical protein
MSGFIETNNIFCFLFEKMNVELLKTIKCAEFDFVGQWLNYTLDGQSHITC